MDYPLPVPTPTFSPLLVTRVFELVLLDIFLFYIELNFIVRLLLRYILPL
jgi:hypothetical protein